MTRTAVLVSGGGGNLQPLLDLAASGEAPNTEIAAVISSVPGVYALERAKRAGVPGYVVERALFPNNASFCNALLGKLRDLDIDLVVCAGFAEKLTYALLHFYRGRVIGVQSALFPAFCEEGRFDPMKAISLTMRLGLRITGATAYFYGEEDTGCGAIITQKAVAVASWDTAATLSERLMRDAEQPALIEAVKLFCSGRLKIEGDSVTIRPEGRA